MVRKRMRFSVLSLAGVCCGVAGDATASHPLLPKFMASPIAAPASRVSAPSEGSAPMIPSARVASSAPVLQDTDSLALRELAALPTEFTEPTWANLLGQGRLVRVKLLGFNDFHGSLTAGRMLQGRPLGGAAILASYLRAYAKDFDTRTVIAHAGDFVGASEPASALFKDEPTVAFFNQLSNGQCDREGRNPKCNLVGVLGNHEFDQGTIELRRLVRGGNHPKGPFLGVSYAGQRYPTLCANVVGAQSGQPLLPRYVVKELSGLKVGFVGAVTTSTPWFVTKSGIADVRFQDEVAAINDSVAELKQQGVRSIVAVIHQGGRQRFSRDLPRDASAVSGEIVGMISKLDGEVDVVISGHSHSVLSALLPNRNGRPTLLTQAFHSGTAFADVEVDIDTVDGGILRKRASIVSVFADSGPGLTPDQQTRRLVDSAEQAAKKTTSVALGHASFLISSDANEHGESAMGDVVADAQRAALQTDFAFTTPAWVRADLKPGPVTWGDLFTIQPFGNRLMRVELYGSQVVDLLNQQWSVESYSRQLHVSGLSYRWDGTQPPHRRVEAVMVRGKPIDPNRRYFAAINQFLAEGGEGFSVLAQAPRQGSRFFDIEALVTHIKTMKLVEAKVDGRIRRIDLRAP